MGFSDLVEVVALTQELYHMRPSGASVALRPLSPTAGDLLSTPQRQSSLPPRAFLTNHSLTAFQMSRMPEAYIPERRCTPKTFGL